MLNLPGCGGCTQPETRPLQIYQKKHARYIIFTSSDNKLKLQQTILASSSQLGADLERYNQSGLEIATDTVTYVTHFLRVLDC